MNKLSLSISLCIMILNFSVHSQKEVSYQSSMAYYYFFNNQDKKADSLYQIIRSKSDFISGRTYLNIAKNKFRLSQIDSTEYFICKAISNGYNFKKIQASTKMNDIKSSINWTDVERKSDSLKKEFFSKLDINKYTHFMSLHLSDQSIRGIYYSLDQEDSLKSCAENITKKHQLIVFEEIKTYITNNKGLPHINEIGYRLYDKLALLLLHSVLEVEGAYEYLLPFLQESVKQGDLNPKYYANILDFYSFEKYGYETFGSDMFEENNEGNLCFRKIKDASIVDIKRKEIGLTPLYVHAAYFGVTLPENYTTIEKGE